MATPSAFELINGVALSNGPTEQDGQPND